ncbi:hypothetical protein BH10CYA1_BH10CYA1_62860 [soil metagenome]
MANEDQSTPESKDPRSTNPFIFPKPLIPDPVSPGDARKIIEKRQLKKTTFKRQPKKSALTSGATASNTQAGAPSIVELARALSAGSYDNPDQEAVDLIYEFVSNNIEFTPTYGQQKGGEGCLIDGVGNSFDQSALMVQLLREAGYTANYVLGQITLDAGQLDNWLGTNSTADPTAASFLLANGRIPNTPYYVDDSLDHIDFSHMWVTAQLSDENWYCWDPSFKIYSVTSPTTDLATAMDYDRTQFIDDALASATIQPDYVEDVSGTAVGNNLTAYATNLATWIKTNYFGAQIDDILGGRQIIGYDSYSPLRQSSLPYETDGDEPDEFSDDIPDTYKIQYEFVFQGIDEVFTTDQTYGKRLTVTFDPVSLVPSLKLDGDVVAVGVAYGSPSTATFTITHNAYFDTWADVTWNWLFQSNYTYLLASSYGSMSRGMSDYHQTMLDDLIADGTATDTEAVRGEQMSVIFYTQQAVLSAGADLIDRISNCRTAFHHSAATFYWQTISIIQDWAAISSSTTSLVGDPDVYIPHLFTLSTYTNALEQSALQQVSSLPSSNTIRVIDFRSNLSNLIYNATPSNWSTVSGQLASYTTTSYYTIGANVASSGRAIVPKTGYAETGPGYHYDGWGVLPPWGGWGGLITPYTYGGSTMGIPGPSKGNRKRPSKAQGGDPVDLLTGEFTIDTIDISVGSAPFPYSLQFKRSYRSSANSFSGPLGFGWSHNFAISARKTSDGMRALGQCFATDAVATIAMLYTIFNIAKNDPTLPLTNVVISVLSLEWWSNQVTDNVVIVDTNSDLLYFCVAPDGTFTPPINCSSGLAIVDDKYQLTTKEQVVFNFNENGKIATWIDPRGVTVSFSYDVTGLILESVTNDLGRTLSFNYTDSYLSSISDGARTVSYSVNGSGLLESFTDAESNDTTYSYDSDRLLTEYFYPAFPTTACVTNTFDSLGRVSTQQNGSQVLNFFISGSRNSMIDSDGNGSVYYFDQRVNNWYYFRDAELYWWSQFFDSRGRAFVATFPELNQVQYEYDDENNIVEMTFVPKPESSLDPITFSYSYDSTFNKPTQVTDGLNQITTLTYDSETGCLLSIEGPEIDSEIPQRFFEYNERGQLTSATDETGLIVQYSYDVDTEVLLSQIRDPGTSPHLNFSWLYEWDSFGNLVTITDPNGSVTSFQYDAKRRMTQQIATDPFAYVTKFFWDENNNLISTQRQTDDISTPWQIYTYNYSLTNRLLSITDPLENSVLLAYDDHDRLQSVTDEESRSTFYEYDADYRLTSVGNSSGPINTIAYSLNGKIISLTDENLNSISREYDALDRLASINYADESSCIFSYDANQNLTEITTRSGKTISYTYDVLNRLATKAVTDKPLISLSYDLAGRVLQISTPSTSDPATGDFVFSYDSAGRCNQTVDPDLKTVSYELDSNGNITKIIWPDDFYVSRVFDELNRLVSVTINGATSSALEFGYDALSRRIMLQYGNGATTSYEYDVCNNLVGIEQDYDSTTSVQFTIGFDKSHREISREVSDDTYLWHPPSAATITYDSVNNVNEYSSIDSIPISYNDDGCLTDDGTISFEYDAECQLIAGNSPGVSVSFTYDPLHRQTFRDSTTSSVRFLYSGWRLIAAYDQALDTLKQRFIYGPNGDELLCSIDDTNTISYFHRDRLGSIVAVTDESGYVFSTSAYSPFGESNSIPNSGFGFAGLQIDPDLNVYYCRFRYYMPRIGRFLQPEPTGWMDDLNSYLYVFNDPLNKIDPSGLQASSSGTTSAGTVPSNPPLTGYIPSNSSQDTFNQMMDTINNQVPPSTENAEQGATFDLYPDTFYGYPGIPDGPNHVSLPPSISDIYEDHSALHLPPWAPPDGTPSGDFRMAEGTDNCPRPRRLWVRTKTGDIVMFDPRDKNRNGDWRMWTTWQDPGSGNWYLAPDGYVNPNSLNRM